MQKEKVVRVYLPGYDTFIDLRRFEAQELVVGQDLGECASMAAYHEQIVKLCLASPEPPASLIEGTREQLIHSIYNSCLKINPWLKIDDVKIVVQPAEQRRRTRRKPPSLESVIGQDEAIEAVTSVMERAEAGIGDPQRPYATMLFMGPTGVGKTMLAKKMAEALELPLVRIDCAEYGSEHEYAKLIGAPPGYVGYDNGGRFDPWMEKLHGSGVVLLFDEIEKAHRKVHDMILHILDEGRFTTSCNKELNFEKCYILMTSNLGAEGVEALRNRAGFATRSVSASEREESFRRAMKSEFRPEFVNRLDDIVIFRELSQVDAEEITFDLLRDLGRRIRSKYHLKVVFGTSVRKHVLDAGFSVEYGARELRRVIKKEVESCLAKVLQSSKPGTTITLTYRGGVVSSETSASASG